MKIYSEQELRALGPVIDQAATIAAEDAKKFRDEGTCVLGAGICVMHKPPRKRNAVRERLVYAPFQGNVGSNRACERALAFLIESGVDAFWYDGVMD